MIAWYKNRWCTTEPLWGKPLINGIFPLQSAADAEIYWFVFSYQEQTV